jgi:hypothetical protein
VIKLLATGWLHIRLSNECWAQVPQNWNGPIPDEYIFHADANRKRINDYWLGMEAGHGE